LAVYLKLISRKAKHYQFLKRAGQDFGTDPRAFIGWENSTKLVFFYSQLASASVMLFKLHKSITSVNSLKTSRLEKLCFAME
jgi:hypothetical protein